MSVRPILQVLTFVLCLNSGVVAYYTESGVYCEEGIPFQMGIFEARRSFTIECGRHYSYLEPWAIYSWKKYEGTVQVPLTNNSIYQVFGRNLQFLNFDIDQEGEYTCYSNTNGWDELMQSFVLSKIRIDEDQSDIAFVHYQKPQFQYLKIRCAYDGLAVADELTYHWFQLNNNIYYPIVSQSDRVYPDQEGHLHFLPVLATDQALNEASLPYVCYVTSPKLNYGRYGRITYLTVTSGSPVYSAPVLKHKTREFGTSANGTASLECVFYGYDPDSPTINRWYLPNGTPVPTGTTKYQFAFNNRRLIIHGVQLSDDGVYHCESENGLGVSRWEPVRLMVCNYYD